jgi:PAS domain S-box-containing protein
MAAKRSSTRSTARQERKTGETSSTLFDTISQGVIYQDADGRITAANQSVERILGLTLDQMMGRTLMAPQWRAIREDGSDFPGNEHPAMVALRTGKQVNDVMMGVFHPKENEYRWILVSAIPEFDRGNGRPTRVLVTFTDVTERTRAERSLKERDAQLASIFRAAPVGIGMVINRVIQEANESLCQMIGYSREELVGQSAHILYPTDEEFEFVGNEKYRQIAERGTGTVETRWKRKDGSILHIILSSTPLHPKDPSKGVTFTALDITDRKRAEIALQMFQYSVDQASDAVFWMNRDGGFSYVNDKACASLGYTRDELIRLQLWDIDPVYPKDLWRTNWAQYQNNKQGGSENIETIHRLKDGTQFPVDVTSRHLWFGDEELHVAVVRDITERKRAELALKQSEEWFRSLFEKASDGIFYLSLNGGLVAVNESFAKMHGYSVAEMQRMNIKNLDTPETSHQFAERMDRMLAGESLTFEVEHYHKDGHTIPLEVTTSMIRISDKQFVLAFHRDITERKQAEEMLRESNARMRAIIDGAPFGAHTYELHSDGRLIFSGSNRSADMILGIDHSRLIGKTIEEAFPRLATTSIPNAYRHVANTGENYETDQVDYEDDQIRGAFEIRAFQSGSNRMTVFFRDITERKQAEEALRRSQEQMELLIENSEDIILLQDIEGKYLHYSGATRYSTTANEVLGRYPSDFHDPKLAAKIKERVRQVCTSGKAVTEDEEIMWAGTRYWFNSQVSPARDAKGNIVGAITVSRNITERRKLEEQLLQAQKLEAVGRLAGGVAHDYNNMIGVILGYAKLIESQLNPLDPLRRNIQAIASAAERSANLTKQLLAFARKQVIAPVPLNLNESLLLLQKMLTRLIGEDIALTFLPGDDLWNVKIDPTQVDQILANLATNARDAIDDVGTITIETANLSIDQSIMKEHPDFTPGDYVMLAFSDNGKGMDKATQQRIFDPFFTTKPKGQGTGLGLATVFGIVKQNNGVIHVYSEPDRGSTFKIYLPRFHGEAETPIEKREEVPLKGTETVLVVEDEEQLLELSCAALEMYGYSILSAKSPGEAIVLCERTNKKIDLLITDVVMPGMNGKELKERLDTLKPGMKTIFMSGYTAEVVANRGILNEGVHFLQKPFTPQTLAKKVREVLNG